MLLTEWNWDDALNVRFEEGREEGFEKGRKDEKLSIARNLIAKGSEPKFVSEITGLPIEKIQEL